MNILLINMNMESILHSQKEQIQEGEDNVYGSL